MPTLKTDFGETPLHALQKWRASRILTKDEQIDYNNIFAKINSFIDKTGGVELNRSKSKTPQKPVKDVTPPSTSKMTSRIKELESPVFKKRNIIENDDSEDDINVSLNIRNQTAFSDESNDSSDDCKSNKNKSKVSGVKEYRNAISALRNRNTELPEVDIKKTKPKSALMNPDEVDDDWLDDDLGTNKHKKRKLSDPLTVVAKKPSYESIKNNIENINNATEPLLDSCKINQKQKKSRISDVVDISENSSDSDSFQRNENVCPKILAAESFANITRELNDSRSKDSRNNMRRRWKRQSTLLKAGFHRKRDDDGSSNSGSDNEFSRKDINRQNIGSFSRKSSSENFGCGTNEGFNMIQNINPNIVQPVNVIQPIKIMQASKNGRPVQTQILPPAAVKVHVEDKVFLISLKLDTINKLTISWLVEEVKSRYYKYVYNFNAYSIPRLIIINDSLRSTIQ
jgi:hypothetical protein